MESRFTQKMEKKLVFLNVLHIQVLFKSRLPVSQWLHPGCVSTGIFDILFSTCIIRLRFGKIFNVYKMFSFSVNIHYIYRGRRILGLMLANNNYLLPTGFGACPLKKFTPRLFGTRE